MLKKEYKCKVCNHKRNKNEVICMFCVEEDVSKIQEESKKKVELERKRILGIIKDCGTFFVHCPIHSEYIKGRKELVEELKNKINKTGG